MYRKFAIKSFLKKFELKLNRFYANRRFAFFMLFSFVIVLWQWPLIFSTNALLSIDFDYFTQAYEAVRLSILHYHQFPWVNAWIGGGVPLYANPQVGVFSVQTLFVLIFGSAYGLKLSIVFYSLVGFWSMFYLLKQNFQIKIPLALMLATAWITNGFFVAHLVSHYSFSLFMVFPLLLFLLLNIARPRYWLYFGVALALYVLSAFHYAAFQGLLILGAVSVYTLIRKPALFKKYLLLFLKSIAIFLLLAGHRIIYTMQYALDFPRLFTDKPNSMDATLKSFIIPDNQGLWAYDIIKPGNINYTWTEHTVFIGYFLSAVLVILLVMSVIEAIKYILSRRESPAKNRRIKLALGWPIGLLFIFFVVMSMGNFGPLSPYAVLSHLPAFSGMRVPSRWLIWSVLVGLIFIGVAAQAIRNKSFRYVIYICVFLGTLEVYAVGFGNDRFFYRPVVFRNSTSSFEQFEDFDRLNQFKNPKLYSTRKSYDRRAEIYSTEATMNNFGQARGYEPIVDTYYAPTARCGIAQGCNFVMSNNARVTYWSPNKIILERLDSSPIKLNMNPSNYWLINNRRTYGGFREAEVLQPFIVNDPSHKITIVAKPKVRNPSHYLNQPAVHY